MGRTREYFAKVRFNPPADAGGTDLVATGSNQQMKNVQWQMTNCLFCGPLIAAPIDRPTPEA
jgi:hypothetical protein